MELKFTIETDDIYNHETDFENLLSDALAGSLIKECKNRVASDKFKNFAALASDTIIADIKLRMENFLSEEIALTEGYGEKVFVGSIEDLIKKRFDDVILRPVNNSGETLQGCTSSSKTWIEWSIEKRLDKTLTDQISTASSRIQAVIKTHIDKKLIEIKNAALKDQVDAVFATILKKEAA